MAGEISFTPSEADYLAANRDWFRRAIRQRRALIWMAGLVAFSTAIGALGSILDGEGESPVFTALGFCMLALVLCGLCYFISYLMLPGRVRRIYRQQKSFGQPWRYAWSDKGLDFSSANGTAKLAWSDMYRWSDGPRTFLFFINEQMFYFIPFHLVSPEQSSDLRATATKHGPRRL